MNLYDKYNQLREKNLKIESSDPNIWENDDAKKIFQNIKHIENKINDFNKLNFH